MNWILYTAFGCYILLFCMLLFPTQLSKRKRIISILKKYPNIRSNHRAKLAKMTNEISLIFLHNGVINHDAMRNTLNKMKEEKKNEKYKASLTLVLGSMDSPQEPTVNNDEQGKKLTLIVSIIGIIVTTISIIITLIIEFIKNKTI